MINVIQFPKTCLETHCSGDSRFQILPNLHLILTVTFVYAQWPENLLRDLKFSIILCIFKHEQQKIITLLRPLMLHLFDLNLTCLYHCTTHACVPTLDGLDDFVGGWGFLFGLVLRQGLILWPRPSQHSYVALMSSSLCKSLICLAAYSEPVEPSVGVLPLENRCERRSRLQS